MEFFLKIPFPAEARQRSRLFPTHHLPGRPYSLSENRLDASGPQVRLVRKPLCRPKHTSGHDDDRRDRRKIRKGATQYVLAATAASTATGIMSLGRGFCHLVTQKNGQRAYPATKNTSAELRGPPPRGCESRTCRYGSHRDRFYPFERLYIAQHTSFRIHTIRNDPPALSGLRAVV